jgi:hypothetical protein
MADYDLMYEAHKHDMDEQRSQREQSAQNAVDLLEVNVKLGAERDRLEAALMKAQNLLNIVAESCPKCDRELCTAWPCDCNMCGGIGWVEDAEGALEDAKPAEEPSDA